MAAALVTAAALAANAVPAQAGSGPVAPESVDIVFTVSDGEAPEGFLFYDPTCPPDIICKPRRVQAFVTFIITTNVSLNGQTLKVDFNTFNGSALAPGDYCQTSGTAEFPPGTFTRAVKVCVNFNTAIEPTENFFLRLSNPNVVADVSDIGEGKIYDGLEVIS